MSADGESGPNGVPVSAVGMSTRRSVSVEVTGWSCDFGFFFVNS